MTDNQAREKSVFCLFETQTAGWVLMHLLESSMSTTYQALLGGANTDSCSQSCDSTFHHSYFNEPLSFVQKRFCQFMFPICILTCDKHYITPSHWHVGD